MDARVFHFSPFSLMISVLSCTLPPPPPLHFPSRNPPNRCCSHLVDFFGAFKRPDGSIRVVLEYMDRGSLADVTEYRTQIQVSELTSVRGHIYGHARGRGEGMPNTEIFAALNVRHASFS